MNQDEMMNLNINAGVLMSGGMLISFASAFGGVAVDFASMFTLISTSADSEDFDEGISSMVEELEEDVLSQLMPQIGELYQSLPDTYAQEYAILSQDEAFADGVPLLKAVNELTPSHLSPVNTKLSKEEISQYLALLVAEGEFAKSFIALTEWLKAIDPEEKERRKRAEEKQLKYTDFLSAIETGDVEQVKELMPLFAFDEAYGDSEEIPLHIAVFKTPENKFNDIFELAQIENERLVDNLLYQLIDKAKDKERAQVVQFLLREMLRLDDGEEQFAKRLEEQLEAGDETWLDWMLEIKPDFSFTSDSYGNPYLTAAIKSGSLKLVKHLLDNGLTAQTEVTFRRKLDDDWLTNVDAFHMARLLGHWDIFDELVKRGAPLNKTSSWTEKDDGPHYYGLTYLGKLLDTEQPYSDDDLLAIKRLVDAGAVVAQHDMKEFRRVVSVYAAHTGKEADAALLDLGVDTTLDEQLVEAVENSSLEQIEQLMKQQGACATTEDSFLQRPALFAALDKADEAVLNSLVEHSVILLDEDNKAWHNAMDYTIKQDNLAGFKALLSVAAEKKFEVLTEGRLVGEFAQANRPDWLEAFIHYNRVFGTSYGMANDERESEGRPVPVIEAVRKADLRLLSLIMEFGGYHESYDMNGKSALQLCLEMPRYDLALALFPHIENQQAEALYKLAMMHYNGRGVAQNFEIALQLFQQAVEQGNNQAYGELGYMYQNGLSVDVDEKKGFSCYLKAAESGDLLSMNAVGIAYMTGKGVEVDKVEGSQWYLKAAQGGLMASQENIAYSFRVGRGIETDLEQAVHWYKQAATQGSDTAQNTLGQLYYNGEGTEQDDDKAFAWFQKAAEQGLAAAQSNLAMMFKWGNGCEQSREDSYNWYLKAAEQGLATAQFEVGHVFDTGVVVERNIEEAARWFKLAADQGHEDAQQLLQSYP